MTADEREKIAVELCRIWPGKFEDAELTDFAARVDRYRVREVLTALNEHKNTQKFRPQVSEILARLKGKEVASAQPGKDMSFADILRQQNEKWFDVKDDREVYMRYWRSLWIRYDEDTKRRRSVPSPASKPQIDAMEESRRFQCVSGCRNSLMVYGMPLKEAEQWAQSILLPPEDFRLALAELHGEIDVPFDSSYAEPVESGVA